MNRYIEKSLTLIIILLFIAVSFQPMVAENTVPVGKESDNSNVDSEQVKDYLFQTLIDISNNPEVKEFLNEHKHDLITRNDNNLDYKNAIQKIYSQNPKLLKSILFTKPKMTVEYLEKNYNKGLEIVDILGEEESLKLADSVITNPELFNELKNIILNDKELSNRIIILEEMNQKLKSDSALKSFSIICDILNNWFYNVSLIVKIEEFFYRLEDWAYYHHHPLLQFIFGRCWNLFSNLEIPMIILLFHFGCINPYP